MVNDLPCGHGDLGNAIRYFKTLTEPSHNSSARHAQSSFSHYLCPQNGNANKLFSARAKTYFFLRAGDSLSNFRIAFMTSLQSA